MLITLRGQRLKKKKKKKGPKGFLRFHRDGKVYVRPDYFTL